MFMPKRVHFNQARATPETLSRNGSSSCPQHSDLANQNPKSDAEMRQRRTRLSVPPQLFAQSPRETPASPSSPRIFHIADPKRTPPHTINIPTILASSRSSFNLRSSYVNLSFLMPRKFAVCIALLVISAMHVCILYQYIQNSKNVDIYSFKCILNEDTSKELVYCLIYTVGDFLRASISHAPDVLRAQNS